MEIITKICTKCGIEKSLNEFSFRTDTQNHRRQCKECVSNVSKVYYSKNIDKIKEYKENNKIKIQANRRNRYLKNAEEIKAKRREYCKNNPDKVSEQKRRYYQKNKDIVKAKTKEYYFNNIDIIKEKSKEYRDKNFEILKEKKKIYIKNNIEAVKERHRKYRQTEKGKLIAKNMKHRRRTAEKTGDVTTEQLKELYENTKFCYWCNNKLTKNDTHLDHYQPISKGGLHTISNLVLSCSYCNKTKSSKDPLEFAQEKGRLF